MSKNLTPKSEGGNLAVVDELLKNGTAILRAKTRDELAEMVNQIPADCKYIAGAVGRSKDDGTFSIQIDKI
jgi:hypothetical protein